MNWLETVITAIGQKVTANLQDGGIYGRIAVERQDGDVIILASGNELVTPLTGQNGGVHVVDDATPIEAEYMYESWRRYEISARFFVWLKPSDKVGWHEIVRAMCRKINCTDLTDIQVEVGTINTNRTSIINQNWAQYANQLHGKDSVGLYVIPYTLRVTVCC